MWCLLEQQVLPLHWAHMLFWNVGMRRHVVLWHDRTNMLVIVFR